MKPKYALRGSNRAARRRAERWPQVDMATADGVPRLLGVEKSAVAQWECGVKRPSGPPKKLLEVLDPNKPDSPVVQVRREITEASPGPSSQTLRQ